MLNPDIEIIERYGYLQPPKIIGRCDVCNEDIEEGYEIYCFENQIFCEECFDEFLYELKKHCLVEY